MNAAEQAIAFDCGGEQLLGVMAAPAAGLASATTAVLIVVGGPQYRAGAHRQFVQVARALAAAGVAALRFDHRGMGDSGGDARSFEQISDDIAAAITALLRTAPQIDKLVLLGLCDGAAAALLYLSETRDPRVHGLCLLNPWVRSEASLARTHIKHYYLQRLGERDFWRKMFSGKVGWAAWRGFARALRSSAGAPGAAAPDRGQAAIEADFRHAMLRGWQGFDGPVLLALSTADLTAMEFVEHTRQSAAWTRLMRRDVVRRVDLEGADHTLSRRTWQLAFETALVDWLGGAAPSAWRRMAASPLGDRT